jgi:hypothetical protein
MSSSYCSTALRTVAGFTLLAAASGFLSAAQAKILEPSYHGPLSNGVFSGLPIRADSAARPAREPVEVVGENCYVVQRQGKSASGRVVAYKVPVCE